MNSESGNHRVVTRATVVPSLSARLSARLSAPLMALVLVGAAGCSSGSSDSSSAGASSVATSSTSTTLTNVPFVGDPQSAWCQQVSNVGRAGQAVAALDLATAPPEQIKAKYDELVKQLDAAVVNAPLEIEAQASTYAKDVTEYRDNLAKSNYNIANIDAVRMQELSTEINSTGAIVDKYNRDVCFGGSPVNTAPPTSATTAPTGTASTTSG